MSILNRFVDDPVCQIDILYDHLVIVFLSGNSISINNLFSINFDGLVKVLNKKIIEILDTDEYIKLIFQNEHTLTINMTDAGYNFPEALSMYFKESNETIVW